MIPAVIEKFSFAGAILILLIGQRVSTQLVPAGILDGTMGILFILSYLKTRTQ